MREELVKIYELLNNIEVQGCQSVKSLAIAMEDVERLVQKLDSGEIVVRRREEGKNGTESKRQDD